MRSFAASHQDITVSFFFFVIHSVLLKLCMCVFLTKNKRTTTSLISTFLNFLDPPLENPVFATGSIGNNLLATRFNE